MIRILKENHWSQVWYVSEKENNRRVGISYRSNNQKVHAVISWYPKNADINDMIARDEYRVDIYKNNYAKSGYPRFFKDIELAKEYAETAIDNYNKSESNKLIGSGMKLREESEREKENHWSEVWYTSEKENNKRVDIRYIGKFPIHAVISWYPAHLNNINDMIARDEYRVDIYKNNYAKLGYPKFFKNIESAKDYAKSVVDEYSKNKSSKVEGLQNNILGQKYVTSVHDTEILTDPVAHKKVLDFLSSLFNDEERYGIDNWENSYNDEALEPAIEVFDLDSEDTLVDAMSWTDGPDGDVPNFEIHIYDRDAVGEDKVRAIKKFFDNSDLSDRGWKFIVE